MADPGIDAVNELLVFLKRLLEIIETLTQLLRDESPQGIDQSINMFRRVVQMT